MSLTKLKSPRPDRRISSLCHRGSHADSLIKNKCKGRSCSCDCHEINNKIFFCIKCDARRTEGEDELCKICKGR